MYREEARDSFLSRLDRDEGDQAEYLQSPKELHGGEDPLFQTQQQVLIIAILHLLPYGRRLVCFSIGGLKKRQGDFLHGERMVLKEDLYVYPSALPRELKLNPLI